MFLYFITTCFSLKSKQWRWVVKRCYSAILICGRVELSYATVWLLPWFPPHFYVKHPQYSPSDQKKPWSCPDSEAPEQEHPDMGSLLNQEKAYKYQDQRLDWSWGKKTGKNRIPDVHNSIPPSLKFPQVFSPADLRQKAMTKLHQAVSNKWFVMGCLPYFNYKIPNVPSPKLWRYLRVEGIRFNLRVFFCIAMYVSVYKTADLR